MNETKKMREYGVGLGVFKNDFLFNKKIEPELFQQ